MHHSSSVAIVIALVLARIADAQQWNDPRALTLVRQATDRRAQQIADSGLVDYQATAHGYVTFLAQLGEGFREPPQVVKADELALEVYWHAPNLSKQRIIGRRDTTLLPTDIQYHRDHLGIVQNNFPDIIRLGEGDEVQDVPHPLSVAGLEGYDFALTDSLRMSIPGHVIGVYEVKVRPKDDRQPRVIGALYLDRDNGQVVRMALSFTRAAFLDKQLEDLFVVLENGLVGTRFWLPRRQEIEIRRTATWLDYPVRGIIRGRWEIREYQLNTGIPRAAFVGPEIVAVPQVLQRSYPWPNARILDSLPPDVRAVTADEIRRVQVESRALVREQALRRARGSALAAHGISDFARFNRIEGVALGAGLSGQFGAGVSVSSQGRYGLDDHELKARLELRWQDAHGKAVRLYAGRDYRDLGEVAERSVLVNSLAAQEFGSDYTDPFRAEAVDAAFTLPIAGVSWTLDLSRERHSALAMHAAPASGRFEPPIPADSGRSLRGRLIAERPTGLWHGGLEVRARGELRRVVVARIPNRCVPDVNCGETDLLRASGDLEVQREIGATRMVARTIAAIVRGSHHVPAQELVLFGGPVTAPGYDYHSLVGNAAVSQRIELRMPVPFPAVSLGRFGRSAGHAGLAPFVTATGLRSATRVTIGPTQYPEAIERIFGRESGFYPSAGAGLLLFFDLVRLDVARGLRDGRWTFSLDVNRMFWSVL
jgi:hypothetical protein